MIVVMVVAEALVLLVAQLDVEAVLVFVGMDVVMDVN